MTSTPRYNWFQESTANEVGRNAFLEQNHLAAAARADKQKISYGNQDRHEKLSFANRDAVERTGNMLTSAIERSAGEDRTTTLQGDLDARAQMSKDFSATVLAAKDISKFEAKHVGNGMVESLDNSLTEQKFTSEANNDLRVMIHNLTHDKADETHKIMYQFTQQAAELKNYPTLEYGELMSEQERHFAELERLHASTLADAERGAAVLGIQADQHHGDTDRRMANYRSDVDNSLDSFTAAQALHLADIRNNLAVNVANNTKRLQKSSYEIQKIAAKVSGVSDGLVRLNEQTHLGIGLAAQQKETLFYKLSR